MQLARELSLDEELQERVRLVGLLHDVGKAVLPRQLILKAGELDEEEWEQMRSHSVAGARIAANACGPGDIVEGVRAHHEAFDGSGYPEGLSGEDIPLSARIVAVADAYDTMSREQPYRAAMPAGECIAELRLGAGKRFDPEIAQACISLLREGRLEESNDFLRSEDLLP